MRKPKPTINAIKAAEREVGNNHSIIVGTIVETTSKGNLAIFSFKELSLVKVWVRYPQYLSKRIML